METEMAKRSSLLDYVFLLRPTLLIPVWTFLLLGYYRALEQPTIHFKAEPEFLLAFVLYSGLMGGVYILNQIVDRETDRANKKLFLISEGYVPLRYAYVEMIGILVIAFLLSLTFSLSFLIFVLLSLGLGIAYSLSPLKLKGRPFLDLLANSLGYGLLSFGVGWLTIRPISGEMFLRSLPYILSVGGVFVNTTIPDIPGDEKAGDRTTGVFLGHKRSLLLSSILVFLALVSALLLRDWVCSGAALVSLPLFLRAAVKGDLRSCFQSIRIGAPVLVIIIGVIFPPFLILLLLAFFSMRAYYRNRFGVLYPTIGDARSI